METFMLDVEPEMRLHMLQIIGARARVGLVGAAVHRREQQRSDGECGGEAGSRGGALPGWANHLASKSQWIAWRTVRVKTVRTNFNYRRGNARNVSVL